MLHHVADLLTSDAFMPHGMCFLWRPELLWLHATSDALIALSYYSIPVALLSFVARRKDLAFPGVFVLFGVFILACGTTHIMGIWTLWNPDYWVDGAIKVITAAASVVAAAFVWRTLPAALALPGRGDLENVNRLLEQRVEERRRAEEVALRQKEELSARVRERTADLEAANERLRVALAEKETLLREVHHRVKNNLQVVSGLLTLQARAVSPELMGHFRESLERIGAMGRVHEQLYRADDAGGFDLATYVEGLSADLARVYGGAGPGARVTARVEAPAPVRVALDAATPLALIVSEVLSNAFKHAFPDGRTGEVRVSLDRVEGGTRLEVRDDGVGLPDNHGERGRQSMGLRLVELLTRQIGAAMRLERDGGGTRFTLVLPDVPGGEVVVA